MPRLIIFILSLIYFFNLHTISNSASYIGKGPVKMTEAAVIDFISYIKGGYDRSPAVLYLTTDGDGVAAWYCAEGAMGCQSGSPSQDILKCENYWQKTCKLFARKKTIVWKNGINKGKGKTSTISDRWSDQEIRDKLKELGFLD